MRIVAILDTTDPETTAGFWAEALRYRRTGGSEPYVVLSPEAGADGPQLVIQRVPEPKTTKNRMHFDLRVADADVEAERDRLVRAGARVISDEIREAGLCWY